MSALGYRPEIDGLRAVAVLAVVLYHFDVPGFSGGYVGVDVFFVISGFLIAGLIEGGLEKGAFRLTAFYERRVRRLFPALFVMLAVVGAASMAMLLPADLVLFGRSLAATALFVSNVEFWREVGYFDTGAELKPLLHTWSLAVEEQFYLAFPVLLWLMRRCSRAARVAVLAALGALSLAAAEWASAAHPSAAFFLAPTRVWELMAGAVLALAPPPRPGAALAGTLGAAGLAMILAATVFFSQETFVPGLAALLPCLGAVLVIHAAGAGPAGRALGHPAAVALGKVSYSLYLWHWPLLVLGGYYAVEGVGWGWKAVLIAASLGLAILSWRYVEQPVRRGRIAGRRLFLLAGTCVAFAAVLGGALVASQGLPGRFAVETRAVLAGTELPVIGCTGETLELGTTYALCGLGGPDGLADFVVWGDSHAMALEPAFQAAALAQGRRGLLAGKVGCPPLLGLARLGAGADGCRAFNEVQLDRALAPEVRDVFLVGRWALYAEGVRYGPERGRRVVLAEAPPRDAKGNRDLFAPGLAHTVERLRAAGKRVVFVHSAPEIGVSVPQAMAKARLTGNRAEIAPCRDSYLARQAFVIRAASDLRLEQLYPHKALCRRERCEVAEGGRPLYRDGHHLNRLGARRLAAAATAALGEADQAR